MNGLNAFGKVWARLKWSGRIIRSVAVGSEVSKSYPDKAIAVLWNRLPGVVRSWRVTQAVGRLIHRRARRVQERRGANYTRFFRNLPQLEVLRDLALEMPQGPVKLAVLGCSTGAELYSALWMIRSARPEQEIRAVGIDISRACIEAAASGVYPLQATEVAGISEASYERLFTQQENTLSVQQWLKEEGVTWRVADASSSDLAAQFGLHDIVLANNFLFHMSPDRAENCLRNVARLVAPSGYLFVSGVDLDVRSRVIRELGLIPMTARLEDIHTAEEGMLTAWPLLFWGLEPIDRTRQDWPAQYTTVFRLPDSSAWVRARSREQNAASVWVHSKENHEELTRIRQPSIFSS